MIIPIAGKVSYSITLDPTVWIFDERKILLENAFSPRGEKKKEDSIKKAAERFDRAVLQKSKPPINPGITKKEGEEILKNSYVMPIRDFINNAVVDDSAKDVTLITSDDAENTTLSLEVLKEGYFLFSINGKPIMEDGPVYFYYKDGSNKDNPIKNIKKILIN
ncbi:hypothetical protein [Oceanobacillus halophilus]|uniref:Peptidyl-prolyl cis-trans isomerase n=1 Tax=Oceanobacillus halophilus TaxID=930130 RepID=A0A495ABE0_9BACI|nr:hypothetical protein [Oceanobacillus halophilus]RKQ37361.1 hypothetical protein D8M06_00735 [Oceanobacillus halophilus]